MLLAAQHQQNPNGQTAEHIVVVDPLVVVVHSHRQSLLGRLLTNNVVVQVLVNFLRVRGWLSACLLP